MMNMILEYIYWQLPDMVL